MSSSYSQEHLDRIIEWFRPTAVHQKGSHLVLICPLAYHVAVYINPDHNGGFDERYCVSNHELATIAVNEYMETGVFKYWQKHHNKKISIEGCYAYNNGTHHIPENALYKVDWDATELSKKYPYKSSIF